MKDVDEMEVRERRSLWRRGWFRAVVVVVVAGAMGLLITAEYAARHAEPLLKHAVIDSLEDRFNEPVELDSFSVSVLEGLQVNGAGLRLLPEEGSHKPLITIRKFSFHTSMDSLLHLRAHVGVIHVDGLEIHIPPHSMHVKGISHKPHSAVKLTVGEVDCKNVLLVIETDKPGKSPLEFQIDSLALHNVGASQPFEYNADLINPKPTGRIQAHGKFGPWKTESPRDTPVTGQYVFSHADLGTIKGIKGTLDSTGHFQGVLGDITVDGTTTTPDFALEGRGHAMPLETKFHAFVDGLNGDTTLAPVQAKLGNSYFTASGTVARVKLKPGEEESMGVQKNLGHDIALKVNMPQGRIEDLLQLAMSSNPPVMRGAVTMQANLHIPPGKESVADKLQLAGTVTIHDVEFGSKSVQDKVDGMSMRAQGKPKDVKEASSDKKAEVASQMTVKFVLGNGMLKADSIEYQLPGAQVHMVGVFALKSHRFDFDGHVRTEAKASQMVTGWKSVLLKPFDGILSKDGAGVQLPISVSGVNSDFHFGLHDSKLTADQMAEQMEKKQGGK